MVGGGNRRDDGSAGISSTNVFAALDSLRRKKKSDKEAKKKGKSEKVPEEVFWAPAPLTVKSWADVDDDDDYFGTVAPPQSSWGSVDQGQNKESSTAVERDTSSKIFLLKIIVVNSSLTLQRMKWDIRFTPRLLPLELFKGASCFGYAKGYHQSGCPHAKVFDVRLFCWVKDLCLAVIDQAVDDSAIRISVSLHARIREPWTVSLRNKTSFLVFDYLESESEDGLDEGDDFGEDHEHDEHEDEGETEVPEKIESVTKDPPQVSFAPKETERQLSKKELKKKELAELDAVLVELGIPKKEASDLDVSHGDTQEKKSQELNGNGEKEAAHAESKNAKKKKKKSAKEVKDQNHQTNGSEATHGAEEATPAEEAEEDTSIDMKERLKKMASMKKKKSSKEMDAAARAAAIEAAARSAKLAAAKKKEKNHYNQQPVR
ncbi:hypothetical protein GIB67_035489 [Kingdonia uniflora]|uniref:Uncharacterized protein n=1 Tax=Kingdonia uniflora TaxID=39325 RepID=A0A7J7P0G5_9MAGN|nr:hypothetical protein GIB67_035489 [Kingdonia uniflora]